MTGIGRFIVGLLRDTSLFPSRNLTISLDLLHSAPTVLPYITPQPCMNSVRPEYWQQ